jgi:hypothetical protein
MQDDSRFSIENTNIDAEILFTTDELESIIVGYCVVFSCVVIAG